MRATIRARSFGVSRDTVREAIKSLSDAGYLVSRGEMNLWLVGLAGAVGCCWTWQLVEAATIEYAS